MVSEYFLAGARERRNEKTTMCRHYVRGPSERLAAALKTYAAVGGGTVVRWWWRPDLGARRQDARGAAEGFTRSFSGQARCIKKPPQEKDLLVSRCSDDRGGFYRGAIWLTGSGGLRDRTPLDRPRHFRCPPLAWRSRHPYWRYAQNTVSPIVLYRLNTRKVMPPPPSQHDREHVADFFSTKKFQQHFSNL